MSSDWFVWSFFGHGKHHYSAETLNREFVLLRALILEVHEDLLAGSDVGRPLVSGFVRRGFQLPGLILDLWVEFQAKFNILVCF